VVDLAYDARLLPPQVSRLGPALHPDELAADKMLALYGRAEGRDFHDVAVLADRYPTERLLELAAAKDRGFDRRRFVEMLGSIDRLRDPDFPDPSRASELRARFEHWRRELSNSLQHPGRGR
jgi:predicted nucleotidyltransferase component of viral defense system